jgi:succinate-semialdehyde dehydrogenase / glutarate-semialdehyde dehydrogenase
MMELGPFPREQTSFLQQNLYDTGLSAMSLISRNPATEELIHEYEPMDERAIETALARAQAAFSEYRSTSFAYRAERMLRAAEILDDRTDRLALLMTREMGKPIAQSRAEVTKCAWVCRYYAEHAERFLADAPAPIDDARAFVAFQPLGPVLAVMPWNFPLWQVIRFAAPALMAGNVGLLKHASNVTGCGLAIEQLFRDAGFEEGVFSALLTGPGNVDALIGDSRVRAATVTGSEGAGRAVGGSAGKHLKPSVLELGGSDPFIVLSDADLERAVEIGVTSRMQNTGQSCIAAKRFIIEEPVRAEFTERFVERVRALRTGDPGDEDIDIGPLARKDLRDDIHDQVRRAITEGAKVLTGGQAPDGPGYFYEPTVLDNVTPGSVAFEEEIFGPVASIISVRSAEEAVELANRTSFGLGGAVFTQDPSRGEEVARRLEVGCAFVNEMVKSDPRLPFGGVKASGYGRELAAEGIRAFVNVKTIWIA